MLPCSQSTYWPHHSSFISDCWDYMFIKNCCKSLTLYNFNGPPSTILDLGCGCGLWAIEAAKQWQVYLISHCLHSFTDSMFQDSTIVGCDVNPVQPKLSMLDDSSALGCRLKWIHGNLYVFSIACPGRNSLLTLPYQTRQTTISRWSI